MFDLRSVFAALRGRPVSARTAAAASAYDAGLTALNAGRPDEALRAFETAVRDAASPAACAAADNKRGVALVELGRPGEALQAFTDALAGDERSAPALVNLGNLLLEDGSVLDAVDYYRAAVSCDGTYALAYRNLGIAFKRLGRRAEAVNALRTAARLEARRRPWRA